jgi:hypothetical protein
MRTEQADRTPLAYRPPVETERRLSGFLETVPGMRAKVASDAEPGTIWGTAGPRLSQDARKRATYCQGMPLRSRKENEWHSTS